MLSLYWFSPIRKAGAGVIFNLCQTYWHCRRLTFGTLLYRHLSCLVVLNCGFASGNRFFTLHLLPDFVDSGMGTPCPGRFMFGGTMPILAQSFLWINPVQWAGHLTARFSLSAVRYPLTPVYCPAKTGKILSHPSFSTGDGWFTVATC